MEVKKLSAITDKWTRVTPGRTEDYKIGIKNPRRDWQEETIAAKANWKAGIDAAHSKDLFAKGVKEAGTGKWQAKALQKGPGRFAEGVLMAGPDFEKGFKRYHEALERTDLGPKFPRRDPRNLQRVKIVVDAMIAEKLK